MGEKTFFEKIDQAIRWIFYVIVVFLPFSKSVLEGGVILSCALWVVKRGALFFGDRSDLPLIRKVARHFRLPSSYLNPFIGVFLLTALFSITGGVMPLHSLEAFFSKILEWFIIYFLVLEVFRERAALRRLVTFIMLSAGITAVDAVLQYHILGKDLLRGHELIEGHRATAGFSHSNSLGSFLAMVIPVAMSYWVISREAPFLRKAAYGFFLGVLVWALVVTFSRGGWLVFALASLLFMGFYNWKGIKKVLFILTVVFVLIGALFLSSNALREEFRLTKQEINLTVSWRWNIWEESLGMVQERPLTGFGINTYMTTFQGHRTHLGVWPTYAHNCFIQMAVETGLLGLSAFLALLGAVIIRSGRILCTLRASLSERPLALIFLGVYSGAVSFILHAVIETNFYSLQLSAMFWILTGLLTPLGDLAREKAENKEER